ncbi:hypothetical protein BF23_24280 [Klebsiella variicola]|nr:hypothetical protein BF23_24280 [Klebsiella variicola]
MTFEGREAVSDATPLVEAAIGAMPLSSYFAAAFASAPTMYPWRIKVSRAALSWKTSTVRCCLIPIPRPAPPWAIFI